VDKEYISEFRRRRASGIPTGARTIAARQVLELRRFSWRELRKKKRRWSCRSDAISFVAIPDGRRVTATWDRMPPDPKEKSIEEAVDWVRRCPDPMPGETSEIEIRPVFETEDFGKELTPELREQEERLRAEVERKRIS